MKGILSEAVFKAEEVTSYGSNLEEYDDQKIKFDPLSKAFFTVIKIDDETFIPVSVRLSDGLVRFTVSNNPRVTRMLRLPIIYRRKQVIESFQYMNNILYVLKLIIKMIGPRLDQIMFTVDNTRSNRFHMMLFKSPDFKLLMKRFRFDDFQNRYDPEEELAFYYFIKK